MFSFTSIDWMFYVATQQNIVSDVSVGSFTTQFMPKKKTVDLHEIEIVVLIHWRLASCRGRRCRWVLAHDTARSVPHEVVITILGARHLLLLVLVRRRRYVLLEYVVHDVSCQFDFVIYVGGSFVFKNKLFLQASPETREEKCLWLRNERLAKEFLGLQLCFESVD